MKKLAILVLTLCLALTCATALAAGELTVVQEAYTPVELSTDFVYGYIFAEVTNSGNQNVSFDKGTFKFLGADGKELTSADVYTIYPEELAPGETGFILVARSVDGAKDVQDVPNYSLTIAGKSGKGKAPVRLTTSATVEKGESRWGPVYQAKVVMTNNTDKTIFYPYVVIALYDAEGKLIYCRQDRIHCLGIPAGQTVEYVLPASAEFTSVWDAAGVVPTTAQAIAYED